MSERLDAIKARLQRAQPSVTQLEVLRNAISTRGTYSGDVKPAGRLRRLPMSTTLNILKANGWIEEGLFIRDEAQRSHLALSLEQHVTAAKDGLATGLSWKMALTDLKHAAALDATLTKTAYWITDVGRKLVPTQAISHINGNIYDNRPENLRIVTLKENL